MKKKMGVRYTDRPKKQKKNEAAGEIGLQGGVTVFYARIGK